MLKTFIKKYFKFFAYFYSYLRYRVFIVLILSIFVGLLDGIGLAFFLPLLNITSNSKTNSDNLMGNLDFFSNLGITLSLGVVLSSILVVFILKNIVRFYDGWYQTILLQGFILKLRTQLLQKFKDFKYSSFIKSDAGRVQDSLSAEIVRVSNSFRSYFGTLQYGVLTLVYVFLAFVANPQFALLVSIGGLLTGFIFKSIYQKTKQLSKSLTKHSHGYSGLLLQTVHSFKYLKATHRIKQYTERLVDKSTLIEKDNKKMGLINAFLNSVREPVVILVIVLVVYLSVNIFQHKMSTILLSIMLFYRALNMMMTAQTNWNGFLQVSGSYESLLEFTKDLDKNKEVYGKQSFHSFRHNIMLKGVEFSYQKNDPIIKNMNLTIHKNMTLALVGESGSGKTTLVNILCGLLAPTNGQMRVDNISMTELDSRQYQGRIGYITQEPVVFDDDVFNNVTFWDERTPENIEKFWEALRKASIDKFVTELKEKENSRLGNNGIMVSGGQKQRISIARELYKDIDILIMDEATSALDSETEKAIQENIDALKGNYTIIIVAHRLSTIKNADQIVLMDSGEVVDVADFETLKNRNTYFARMVSMQEV